MIFWYLQKLLHIQLYVQTVAAKILLWIFTSITNLRFSLKNNNLILDGIASVFQCNSLGISVSTVILVHADTLVGAMEAFLSQYST